VVKPVKRCSARHLRLAQRVPRMPRLAFPQAAVCTDMRNMHENITKTGQVARKERRPVPIAAKTMRPENHRLFAARVIRRMVNLARNRAPAAPRIDKFAALEQSVISPALRIYGISPEHVRGTMLLLAELVKRDHFARFA